MPRTHVTLLIRIVLIFALAFGALARAPSFSPAPPAVAKVGKGKGGEEGRGGPKKDNPGRGNGNGNAKGNQGKSGGNSEGNDDQPRAKDNKGKGNRDDSEDVKERGRGQSASRVEIVAVVVNTVIQQVAQTPTALTTTIAQPTTLAQPTLPPPSPTLTVGNETATVEATAEFTETIGSIVVELFECPIAAEQAEYDWFNECDPAGEGERFRLVPDIEDPTDNLRAVTDAGGHARFSQLASGVYVLTQLESDWCHAKSDGVNEDGNLVVTSGERTTVWVFSCLDDASSPTSAP